MSGEGPDYSAVTSLDAILPLVERGDIVPMLLLPEQFGGHPVRENVVYVPAFVAELKERADINIIAPLVAGGKITRYSAQPRYEGASFIPISIEIVASEPGHFIREIAIWGSALRAPD